MTTRVNRAGAISDARSCEALDGSVLDVCQVDARGECDMTSAAFDSRGAPLEKIGGTMR